MRGARDRGSDRPLVEFYRFLRGWRWWAVRYRAWRSGGRLLIGRGSYLRSPDVRIEIGRGATLKIGTNVILRRLTTVSARELVEIGDDALLAEMVTIRDHSHAIRPGVPYRLSGFTSSPVRIGRNVWLGNKVTVTAGVTIGENAIVGANAVVTHDIPRDTIAVGVPARLIRGPSGDSKKVGKLDERGRDVDDRFVAVGDGGMQSV